MDTETPETLNTEQCMILLWGGEVLSQRFLAHLDLVACIAFKCCSMQELLCPENRSCEETVLQNTVGKDRSYFHLTWSDPRGSLGYNSHSAWAESIHGLNPFPDCRSIIKNLLFSPTYGLPRGAKKSISSVGFQRCSSVHGEKTASQAVLPCVGQDPAQSWDVTALPHVLFLPRTPRASSKWV